MTDSTTDKGPRPPRTEAGRRVFRSLDLPDATSAVVTVADVLAIEAEAVGLMYGSDQEAGYAALAEAEAEAAVRDASRWVPSDTEAYEQGLEDGKRAAAPDAGLREAAQAVMDEWDALGPTGTHETTGVFARLRAALAAHPDPAPEVWNPRRRVGGYYPPAPAPGIHPWTLASDEAHPSEQRKRNDA